MPIEYLFVMAVRCSSKNRNLSFSKFSQAVLREADDSREETTRVFAKAWKIRETIKLLQLLKEMFIYVYVRMYIFH